MREQKKKHETKSNSMLRLLQSASIVCVSVVISRIPVFHFIESLSVSVSLSLSLKHASKKDSYQLRGLVRRSKLEFEY